MPRQTSGKQTRLIFIGGPTLTDGFRLIGFETLTDPDTRQVDGLVSDLLASHQNAFIVLEQYEHQVDSKLLQQVRSEGGRIVISEVPSFKDPSCFHCELDRQISRLLGGEQLAGGVR